MKKVEELTLYLIEKDKKDQEQINLINMHAKEIVAQKEEQKISAERMKKIEQQLNLLLKNK